MSHPVSIETNTGDGLRMAMKAGAMLANIREAWWIPVAAVPVEENPMGRVLINGQRTLPHSIMVNKRGRRFTNEAANYNAFGGAFHVEDVSRFEYANLPCWLVFDQNYADKYGFRVASGIEAKGVPAWVPRGDTPAALAALIGADPKGLTDAIERWNAHCADGADPDFGRGDSAFDRWWGDPYLKGTPEATLGPLDAGPYYAVEIHSGCFGTKGGPKVEPSRPGDRRRRRPDPRPLRRRQRDGIAVRHDLRRPRRDARSGDGVRLPRRPPRHDALRLSAPMVRRRGVRSAPVSRYRSVGEPEGR